MRQRDENKTLQIYDATLGLVEQKGLAGICINDICKEAGIAIGTFYIYFKNKDELINELFIKCRTESADFYFIDYIDNEDFDKAFYKIFHNIVKYRLLHFRESIFLEQCYHSPYISEDKRQLFTKVLQPLYTVLAKAKEEVIIKDQESQLLIWFTIGCINEVVKGKKYSNTKVTDSVVESLYNMCLDAIKR